MIGTAGDDNFTVGPGVPLAPGSVIDGGFGFDSIEVEGTVDLSAITLSSIEELNYPGSGLLTLSADEVAHGLASDLQIGGGHGVLSKWYPGSGAVAVLGSANVPVDLSGWTWLSGGATGSIDFTGSAGADELIMPAQLDSRVALGGGSDVLILSSHGWQGGAGVNPVRVLDFQAGAGGDVLDLVGFLDAVLQNYMPGSDPFAAHRLMLTAVGTFTYVQVDFTGNGQFLNLVELRGVDPSRLTAANLGGLTPPGAAPGNMQTAPAGGGTVTGGAGDDDLYGQAGNDMLHGGGGSNLLDGGGGLNTASFDGPYRTYTSSVVGGGGTVSGGPEAATDTLANIQRLQFVDGYLATSPTDTAGQIYRLYEAALGRAPDQEGLADWVHLLNSGTSLETAASGFLGAPEYQRAYGLLDDTDFVTQLYHNVLQRAPDAAGLQSWLDFLNAGHSRAEVLVGFSESPEDIRNLAEPVREGLWIEDAGAPAQVARLYDTVFGRLPDAAGLTAWTHVLQGGATLQSVADGFIASPEFQGDYSGLDNAAFVRLLYHNVLHRDPDTIGLTSWVNALNQGHSRAEVVVGFSESPEHIADTAAHIDSGIWLA
jgi:hypothetical protein